MVILANVLLNGNSREMLWDAVRCHMIQYCTVQAPNLSRVFATPSYHVIPRITWPIQNGGPQSPLGPWRESPSQLQVSRSRRPSQKLRYREAMNDSWKIYIMIPHAMPCVSFKFDNCFVLVHSLGSWYASWKTAPIPLLTHKCVLNPFISIIHPGEIKKQCQARMNQMIQ